MWPGTRLVFDGGSERTLAADKGDLQPCWENQSAAFPGSAASAAGPDVRTWSNVQVKAQPPLFILTRCFSAFFSPRFGPAAVRCVRLRAAAFDSNGGDRNNHTVWLKLRPWQTTRDMVSSQHRRSLLHLLSSHARLTRLCLWQMGNNPFPSQKVTSGWQIPVFVTVIPSVLAEQMI